MRISRLTAVVLVAVLAFFVGTAVASHRPPPTVDFASRGRLGHLDASNQHVRVERTKGSADHVVAGITWPPGSSIGWHRHPGVVLVTVVSGRLQHVDVDCEKTVYGPGDSFYEQGGVHLARNVWDVETKIYATWIMPSWKQALTVPADTPEGCPIH